jgi:hypothetical protein
MHTTLARSLLIAAIACIAWAIFIDNNFFHERVFYAICGTGSLLASIAYKFKRPRLCLSIATLVAVLYLGLVAFPITAKLFSGEWSDLAHTIKIAYTAPTVAGWPPLQSLFFRFDLLFFMVFGTAYFIAVFVYSASSIILSATKGYRERASA